MTGNVYKKKDHSNRPWDNYIILSAMHTYKSNRLMCAEFTKLYCFCKLKTAYLVFRKIKVELFGRGASSPCIIIGLGGGIVVWERVWNWLYSSLLLLPLTHFNTVMTNDTLRKP